MTMMQASKAKLKARSRAGVEAVREYRRRFGRVSSNHPAVARITYSSAELEFLGAVERVRAQRGRIRPEWPDVGRILAAFGQGAAPAAKRAEFDRAMESWRAKSGRRFPAWTDVFRVLATLGLITTGALSDADSSPTNIPSQAWRAPR